MAHRLAKLEAILVAANNSSSNVTDNQMPAATFSPQSSPAENALFSSHSLPSAVSSLSQVGPDRFQQLRTQTKALASHSDALPRLAQTQGTSREVFSGFCDNISFY